MSEKIRIHTLRDLSRALRMPEVEIQTLVESLSRNPHPHYKEWHQLKKSGEQRTIREPMPYLKSVQRRLNRALQQLDLPDSVHGARRKHSSLSNAAPHRFADALLQSDISNFFPSVTSGRVYKMFCEQQECSPDMARALTRLTTYKGCLPQGAPTSPLVATIVAKRLITRASNLARSNGGKMTIYIDDLTISGVRDPERSEIKLKQIMNSEGFTPHPEKTGVSKLPERLEITGVVVGHGTTREPNDIIRKIKAELQNIKASNEPEASRDKHIARCKGLIQHLRRLNPGSAKYYNRQLSRLTSP